MINRSKTRDIPKVPVIVQGRIAVRNSGRGNHLGQRSCASATKGRTYERKRSDQNLPKFLARRGPSTYGTSWSSGVSSAITNATTLSVSPTVGSQTCGCPNSTNTAIVTHDTASTCGTANGGTACSDGTQPGYYVTISATATYTSVMPYPIINNPTLSSLAIVRIQ